MEWLVAAAIALVIVASFGMLTWSSRRRHWNVDREDDERRESQ